VEWLPLVAEPRYDHIHLGWQTLWENNNAGFVVERTLEPTAGFDSLSWVNGVGFSDSPQDYAYDDYAVEQARRYYYRLRQLDYDGRAMYSNLASAILDPNNLPARLQVYPNPTAGDVAVRLLTPEAGPIQLRLYNVTGQLIWEQADEAQAGTTQLYLQLGEVAAGTYMLELTAPGIRGTTQLVIIR
jgi:hypothetical protein